MRQGIWYRVYPAERGWWVDTGAVETQKLYRKVVFAGVVGAGTGEDPEGVPKAWLSVCGELKEFQSRDGLKVAVLTTKI